MKYAKIFDTIWDGSMRGQSDPLFVFMNLLTHSDETGTVDRHWKAIAEETGLSVERVQAALMYLESPDPESRSPEQEGRRIVRLDTHRNWGWRVVNHAYYRELCSRKQNAERQARFRERNALVTLERNASLPPVGVYVGIPEGGVRGGNQEPEENSGERNVKSLLIRKLYRPLSKKLFDTISKHRKVTCTSKLSHWDKILKDLVEKDGIPIGEVSLTIEQYGTIIGGEFIPEAYGAAAFREKYPRIVSAIRKSGSKMGGCVSRPVLKASNQDKERRRIGG